MPQWQVLRTWWHACIIGLQSGDSTNVWLQIILHTLWILLEVPWEPLTLLVVPLTLVNGLHHWPVLKKFSSMIEFNTSIHILEIVLWSVGIQDPGLRLHEFGLRGLVRDYIHDSLIRWLHPYLILSGWLWQYLYLYMVLSTRWLRPYHRSSSICLLDGYAHA